MSTGTWRILFWSGERLFLPDGSVDPDAGLLDFHEMGCLVTPPAGLGFPGYRTDDTAFSQRDGVDMYLDWYEDRRVEFTVTFTNDSCPGCPDVRQKIAEVFAYWNRNCPQARLVIVTDCTPETDTFPEDILPDPFDRAQYGPYILTGRPRQARIIWGPSNVGIATIVFGFEVADHRIGIVQPDLIDGNLTATQCVTVAANDTEPLVNAGDLPSFPTLTLTGPLTAPFTLGFGVSGFSPSYLVTMDETIDLGETVTFDTEKFKGYYSDGTRYAGVNDQVNGGGIEPDIPDEVSLETGDAGDPGTVEVCWDQSNAGV